MKMAKALTGNVRAILHGVSFIPLRDMADCIFNIIAVVLWDNASSNLP